MPRLPIVARSCASSRVRRPAVLAAVALSGALVTSAAPLVAQDGAPPRAAAPAPPDTAARRAAMDRLQFLVGDWAGPATAWAGPGKRVTMRQTERVRRTVGGQVMTVEGVGRSMDGDVPGDTVFHAFGLIDWTPERGYVMRSTTLAGHQAEFPLTVSDSGFAWTMAAGPGGRVDYVMRLLPDGTWDERGTYVMRDGRTMPFVTMQVRRTAGER